MPVKKCHVLSLPSEHVHKLVDFDLTLIFVKGWTQAFSSFLLTSLTKSKLSDLSIIVSKISWHHFYYSISLDLA